MALRRLSTIPYGVLVRGGNLTVNNQTWAQMWAAWDWTGWIKFQIDALKALGGNCVRIIGGPLAAVDGTISQATYLARWAQFLDYTAAQGVLAYPCGGDFGPDHWGSMTDSQATAIWTAWADLCDDYPHVIGMDISNEGVSQGIAAGLTQSQVLTRMTMLANAVRTVSTKPIAHSRAFDDNYWANTFGGDIRPISDFHDIHVYYDALTPTHVDALINSPWGDLPILLGEFGAYGITHTTEQRTGRYSAAKAVVEQRTEVIGALAWAITDTNTGTWGTSGLVAPDGAVRTDIADIFATMPTTRQIVFPRVVSATVGGSPVVLDLLA